MKKIKIVKRYFTKQEAVRAVAYQKTEAKKWGRLVEKAEVKSADFLHDLGGSLKREMVEQVGFPDARKYIVIVYYSEQEQVVTKPMAKVIRLRARKAKKQKDFAIVKYFRVTDRMGKVTAKSTISIVLGKKPVNRVAIGQHNGQFFGLAA